MKAKALIKGRYCKVVIKAITKRLNRLCLILELLKNAKRLQSDSVFMNKIKERSNTAVFKPNATIKLGFLFNTNCSRHNHENKEFQIILIIPDFSSGIIKT